MGKWREAEARKDLADQVAFGGASLVAMCGPEVIGIVAVLRDWIMPVSGSVAFRLPARPLSLRHSGGGLRVRGWPER